LLLASVRVLPADTLVNKDPVKLKPGRIRRSPPTERRIARTNRRRLKFRPS
jgi:hypothetical protein